MTEEAGPPTPVNSFHKAKKKALVFFLGFGVAGLFIVLMLQPELHYEDSQLNLPPSPVRSKTKTPPPAQTTASSRLKPTQRQLLVITKGRSGSTFTSALIKSDPGVFYAFEPLISLQNEQRNAKHPEIRRERTQALLKAYLTCDFMNVSAARDLSQRFHSRTNYGSKFFACQKKMANGFAHIQCLIDFVKWCRSRVMSFVKVIRLPMAWSEALLQQLPGLQILYLIRDPRAVIFSQSMHFHSFAWPVGSRNGVIKFCEDLKDDFDNIARLGTLFPGRIRVIRYENGATDPFSYARDIYEFIGLDFTNETDKYISFLTSPSGTEDNKVYGVRRSNATKVVNKWRTSPGAFKSAIFIDESCGDVYSKVGYVRVTSAKHLSSLNKPLFSDPKTFINLQKKLEGKK